MNIAVIGIGLIGGSFALAMRSKGVAGRIVGVDNIAGNCKTALEMGLVDEIMSLEDAVECSDLVVISIPVDAIPLVAVKVLNRVREGQVVIDMGSTKEELCDVIALHPNRGRFVATHPMWGTEYSGPHAAVEGAFAGRTVVICQSELSDDDALARVTEIYRLLEMPVKYMDAEEHDLHAAYVSHISHITSFALALTVLEKELEDDHILDLAGGGFESTVRLAKSSPEMWTPIFMQNKYNILDVLREHIHQLQVLRRMIEKDDTESLKAVMRKANGIKRVIK